MLGYPSLGSLSKLPTSTGVRNARGRSQQGLNQRLQHRCNEDFQLSRMRSLSCWDLSFEDDEQDGLRARAEQALGELAQALIDNPTLHDAVTAALGAREKALEAQQAAMSALNLPSATDVERLERRLRSFSQRLEEVEEQLDDANREIGTLRRQLAQKSEKKVAEKPKADKT
jgi:chromosome segregation ATPase